MTNQKYKNKNKEKYSLRWFKKRAFLSLKKISDGIFDYSDSLLLYILGSDKQYEKVQQKDSPYYKIFVFYEHEYLRQIAKYLVTRLPESFEYIDLGPGTEHKEQYIFNQLKEGSKNFIYIPVDINKKFLAEAVSYAKAEKIETKPIQSSFEELPNVLKKSDKPRFVSLGFTYSNYRPNEILKLLAEIAGDNGFAFINSQIRERVDVKKLADIYSRDIIPVAKKKLKLLGLNTETDIKKFYVNEKIEMWCVLKRVTPRLAKMGLRSGDKILLFQSLRPSMKELKQDLDASRFSRYTMFDIGKSFVGVLLEKPL